MAEENPNVFQEEKVEEAAPTAEVVSKAQYDALVKQLQEVVAEANRRIALLENDKKVLKDALATQSKLIEKILGTDTKESK